MKALVTIVLAACMFCLLTGCALDETARTGMVMVKDVTLKAVDRIPIDSGALAANANLNNPHYRVLAVMVNGVLLDVGLDGVVVQGNMQAQGAGGPAPIDPDLRERLDKILNEPSFWEKILSGLQEQQEKPPPNSHEETP